MVALLYPHNTYTRTPTYSMRIILRPVIGRNLERRAEVSRWRWSVDRLALWARTICGMPLEGLMHSQNKTILFGGSMWIHWSGASWNKKDKSHLRDSLALCLLFKIIFCCMAGCLLQKCRSTTLSAPTAFRQKLGP